MVYLLPAKGHSLQGSFPESRNPDTPDRSDIILKHYFSFAPTTTSLMMVVSHLPAKGHGLQGSGPKCISPDGPDRSDIVLEHIVYLHNHLLLNTKVNRSYWLLTSYPPKVRVRKKAHWKALLSMFSTVLT